MLANKNSSSINAESSVKDVCQYLSTLSLNGFDFSKDVNNFESELVDGSCFLQLDKAEIMNLGIKKMSKRNALFKHISELNSKNSEPVQVHQPSKIESTKAINDVHFDEFATVSVEHDSEMFLEANKSPTSRKRSAKTQEFSGFDADAPEFYPSQSVLRTSTRRYSTATTLSPRNGNGALRSSPKLRGNMTVQFQVDSDENSVEIDAASEPKEICIDLSATKQEKVEHQPASDESSNVLESDLQDLGYEQAKASTQEFEVNLAVITDQSDTLSRARTTEFSLEAFEMEPSEVISLPPSVVLTDVVKPPQIGGGSQANSVENGEMDCSPFTSVDFENNMNPHDEAAEAEVIEMALKMEQQSNLMLPTASNDGQSMENSCETMEMSPLSQDSLVKEVQLPKTTSAPYVMRLNVKKSSQHNNMAVVTFPAIFKDITGTNTATNQTKATFCLQNKTLQQLNVHHMKLTGKKPSSQSNWKTKQPVNGSNNNPKQASVALFDETQCEHTFDIQSDQLSVVFNHVKSEFPKFFRNYYSISGTSAESGMDLLPSNTLVMVTYDFNNGCVLDFKPIPVRGSIKTLCDANGLTWIESDLFVTGKMQYFGGNDSDASENCIYSVQSMKLEDQRRRTSLVDQNGMVTKQRSVVLVNDESFDYQAFQSHGHYVEDAVSKVEFFLKLTTPCKELYSESVLVEAWNLVKVIPSLKQQKKMDRRLARQRNSS